jgi:hypothetical protein
VIIGAMGFRRNIGRAAAALAILASGTAAVGESREPLVVTRLPEPELQIVAVGGSDAGADAEAVQRFAKALGQSALADRQTIAARCRDVTSIPASGASREAWEADCRYHRR